VIGRHPSENVRVVSALMVPFVLVFGVYVIVHGHYGPGGGFAGGVVLAVGVVLAKLTLEQDLVARCFPGWLPIAAMCAGMATYLLAGFVPVLTGGAFLDYAAVPGGGLDPARLRYLGIMIVEVGVGAVVFGGILAIFEVLARAGRSSR
jgi:multicomponent Na+:H+ antiporter subunit B